MLWKRSCVCQPCQTHNTFSKQLKDCSCGNREQCTVKGIYPAIVKSHCKRLVFFCPFCVKRGRNALDNKTQSLIFNIPK